MLQMLSGQYSPISTNGFIRSVWLRGITAVEHPLELLLFYQSPFHHLEATLEMFGQVPCDNLRLLLSTETRPD